MERVTTIFLSCVLLSASSLLASNVEETYQAALTQEKGEGNLEEAIRLYKQVIEAHEKGEGDESIAARAQLRIGVCQEKLGLAQARQTYEAVRDKYPDQPQVAVEAMQRLGSTHQREATIERPSARMAAQWAIPARESAYLDSIHRHYTARIELVDSAYWDPIHQLHQHYIVQGALIDSGYWDPMEWAELLGSPSISEQMRGQLHELMEQSKLKKEQIERQLEAIQQHIAEQTKQQQRRAEHLQRQLEHQQRQLARQLRAIQRQGFRSERIIRGSDQRYYHYANTPPVVPYAYEEVAAVPIQWKFRLEADGSYQQRYRDYATLDFDDADWATINIGQAYEDQGYAGYDGWATYRATFAVAADSVRPVLMAFGGLGAKDALVYVNGHWVGRHYDQWNRPFILDISDHVVRDGENAVALYLHDDLGMGGVYGLINVHQPTDEVDTDAFASNRGGYLEMVDRNGWPVFKAHIASGQPYSRYARRPPRIPYAYTKVAAVPVQWKFSLYADHYQEHQDLIFSRADFDDSDWVTINIGQAWEDQGYIGYDEGAWYRTRIEVSAAEDQPVHLAFGGVDNEASVYVNGTFVGEHQGWNTPFILDISEAVNYKGENAVAVWVYDGANMGGIFGTIEVIQPTSKENLDRYLANRGISATQRQTHRDDEEKRSFWSRFF
jgi:TolA-binding protein